MNEVLCLIALAIVGIVSIVAMVLGKGVVIECFGIKLDVSGKRDSKPLEQRSCPQRRAMNATHE